MKNIDKTKEQLICELSELHRRNAELDALLIVKKQEVETLKYREKRNLAWLESSPVCTKIVDLDFNLQYMSNAGIHGLGISDITPLYGKPYPFDFYPESFRSTMIKNLRRVKETGEIIAQVASVNDIQGKELWFHSTLVPVNDDKGRIDYIIVVSINITEQKQAEVKLLAQSQIISNMEEGASLIRTSDAKIVYANPACEEMFGYGPGEMIGKHASILNIPAHISPENVINGVVRGLKVDGVWRGEVKNSKKDGSLFWCSATLSAYDHPVYGEVWLVVHSDITERKRAEEQHLKSEQLFRSYFDLGLIGMATTSLEKGWVSINDKLCEIVGYSKDELIKLTWSEITHPDDLEADMAQFNRVLAGEIEGYALDKRFIRKDGKIIHASISARCIRKEDGSIDYFVALIQDITVRKLAEEALRRDQKMDAIGQLSGGIAHDFNNILGIIIGNLSFLKDEAANNDKVLNRIKKIDKAAQRATDLSKQLLSISRKQETEAVPTNINKLIRGMGNLITRSITPEVEVVQQFFDGLWLTEIAPGDFEDSLLNLILNARDAMPDCGRLTIETSNCILDAAYCTRNHGFTPGEYVQLTVSDTGMGILSEQQERIFEPFFTTKPKGKGTGLGLAMVFGFCKRSKGHIKVYSELGIGTTFSLYLPRSTMLEQTVDTTEQHVDVIPRGYETILIVDDEKDLLELARESLQSVGYKVLTANNGKQALERLAKNPAISLLFSDVVMPGGINGYELAELATKNQSGLKVLLTSGFTEKATAHNEQSRFNINLLSKPYSQSALTLQVRILLGGEQTTSAP